MAWPVDSLDVVYLSGTTTLSAANINKIQSGLAQVRGGSMPITRLSVTGGPFLSGMPGGLAASGAIKAVGDIASVSGEIRGLHTLSTTGASVTADYGAGTTPSLSGSPTAGAAGGVLFVKIGPAASGNSSVVNVGFSVNYPSGFPRGVTISPANLLTASVASGGAGAICYATSLGSGGFSVFNGSTLPLASGQVYGWNYTVAG